MTEATPPTVGLDDPRVQARVGEKAQAHADAIKARHHAALTTPQQVGAWTFHPPNACTFDAIYQPALLQLAEVRYRFILGYLLTIEPSGQIAAAQDTTRLRTAAAAWQEQIPAEHLPEIIQIIHAAFAWVQKTATRDTSFFFEP